MEIAWLRDARRTEGMQGELKGCKEQLKVGEYQLIGCKKLLKGCK
jgi:hypothetical protein